LTVVVLVVIASITVPLATTAVWARRTVVNTNEWVDTVGPLARERTVQIALGDYLTTQIMGAIDVEQLFTEVLPERGQFLAAPLENAIEGFVRDKVDEVVRSDAFARLWEAAVRRAQVGALAVLRGETPPALQQEDGRVVLNLLPVINTIIASINESSPQVLGRDVTLPRINSDELPAAARERLERALGRPLPEDFGSIQVFEADKLSTAQDIFHMAERTILLLVGIALASIVGAVALSRSRRRTILQLVFGIALGLVLVRRMSLRTQADLLELFRVEVNRAAVESVSDRVLSGLLDWTRWLLYLCGAVAAIALLTGPYRWAVTLRRSVVSLVTAAGGAAGRVRDEATVEWARAHQQALQISGLVVGALILLLFNLSWLGFLLVVGLVAAFELWLARLSDRTITPDG
jgi:hypothetical protein